MKKISGNTTKRFGARYGSNIKRDFLKIEQMQRSRYDCPYCEGKSSVKRASMGIWECRKCGKRFTSKAYSVEAKKW
jgi:large subunit ribosomal protein L37Ae